MSRSGPWRRAPQLPRQLATGRLRKPDMNGLEAAWAQVLEARRGRGELAWWVFEGIKLKLADSTFYTPDFAVMGIGSEMEFHEVKGFWRDDARVKIKVAAGLFPFRFLAVRRVKQAWQVEEI
jgi:hypothetical protein